MCTSSKPAPSSFAAERPSSWPRSTTPFVSSGQAKASYGRTVHVALGPTGPVGLRQGLSSPRPWSTQLDLGAAPGGWTQVAAQRTRLTTAPLDGDARAGFVVGVDRERTNRGTIIAQ